MRFMTGLAGLSGRRVSFGGPGLGNAQAIPQAARERIDAAAHRKDDGFKKVERARGLARAVERNQGNLVLLLGLDKAQQAVSEAKAAVQKTWAAYEQAAVELENARVAAGLTRLEV